MADSRIKIGILGGGMISQIGHLPFYLNDPRCELAGVAESRLSLIEALEAQLGPERVVRDHRTLLHDASIQAIVISAPRPATGPLTEAALSVGKHVMAEKPMAHSVVQAQRLVRAAKSHDLIYAVGFMKRYDPGVQAAKRTFDHIRAECRLGELLFARFYNFSSTYAVPPPVHARPRESRTERFPVWPQYPDWLPERFRDSYAWFLNATSHNVNLLRFFFPDGVAVASACNSAEGGVVATMTWNEVPIVLETSKSAAGCWIEGAELLFERGRLALAIPSPMAINRVSEVTLDDAVRGLIGVSLPTEQGWSFAHQARGFIDALAGGPMPLTTGEEALADMELTEQIWKHIAA